jgi:hypothetical protein
MEFDGLNMLLQRGGCGLPLCDRKSRQSRTAHHCRADRLGVELAREWKPKRERARARQQGLSQR